MEQGELGNRGYISRFQEENSRRLYAWLRSLCWGLLIFAFIVTVADDILAQSGDPTGPQPASVDFNIVL
jgi:hypothetical protein